MKKRFAVGEIVKHAFKVTRSDLATFQGANLHQVCSTFALAREIEWCSRLLVLREKEEDEEGIGTKLSIDHKSPALLGATVEIVAEVKSFEKNELICSFQANTNARLIADGITGQKVLKKSRIKEIFSTFDEV